MIESLVLTLVILLCLGLVIGYALPPIADNLVQWAVRAIVVVIAVVAILHVWHIA